MRLSEMRCVPCEAGTPPLKAPQVARMLKRLPKGWSADGTASISKRFRFRTYPETIGFVSRVALVAQEEGHHPDMQVGYGQVTVTISTHSIGGLSENDFILAAKIEA